MCIDFKKWLFITNHLKSKNTSIVKKILLGVPNEAVLIRITKVHLNIKRSLHWQTFSNCKLFLYTQYISEEGSELEFKKHCA